MILIHCPTKNYSRIFSTPLWQRTTSFWIRDGGKWTQNYEREHLVRKNEIYNSIYFHYPEHWILLCLCEWTSCPSYHITKFFCGMLPIFLRENFILAPEGIHCKFLYIHDGTWWITKSTINFSTKSTKGIKNYMFQFVQSKEHLIITVLFFTLENGVAVRNKSL